MRIRRILTGATVLLVVTCFYHVTHQQVVEWTLLGAKRLAANSTRHKVSVGKSGGKFFLLRLRVEDAPVDFKAVLVHFADGDQKYPLQKRVNPGQAEQINCRCGERTMKSVEISYEKTVAGSPRPTVLLEGAN